MSRREHSHYSVATVCDNCGAQARIEVEVGVPVSQVNCEVCGIAALRPPHYGSKPGERVFRDE